MPKVFWKKFITQTFCYASSIFGCWVFIKFYQRNALFSYYGNIRFLFFPKSLGQMFKSLFHCCRPSVDLYWWFMSFCANISITCSTTAELFNWLVFCHISKSDGWHFQCSTTYRILPWTTTKTCLRQCWTFKSW